MKLKMYHLIVTSFFLTLNSVCEAQNWTNVGNDLPRDVRTLFSDSNYLYVGMQSYGNLNPIIVWNGATWDTLSNPCPGWQIYSMVKYQNHLIIAGSCGIQSWDGSSWHPLGSNYGSDEVYVYNNELYACGSFDSIGGINASLIAKWDGSNWSAIDTTQWFFGNATCISEYNGELYMGGNMFCSYPPIREIGKWDGTHWSQVGNGIVGSISGVNCFQVYNGELYVGGLFTVAQGNPGNYIAKWNGTAWSDVGGGMGGIYGQVQSMRIHNNELYVGGDFISAGGVPAQYIAKWNGSEWCALGGSFDNVIGALEFYHDTLFIGGGFWTISGDSIQYIAKWAGGNYVDTCSLSTQISNIQYLINQFSLFPNPTSSTIHIKNDQKKDAEIEFTDALGRTIYRQTINSIYTDIDVSGWRKGMYFYNIIDPHPRSLSTPPKLPKWGGEKRGKVVIQ